MSQAKLMSRNPNRRLWEHGAAALVFLFRVNPEHGSRHRRASVVIEETIEVGNTCAP